MQLWPGRLRGWLRSLTELEKERIVDLTGKHINVNVLFDVVSIEVHCGDDYEAQVLFDDVAETLKAKGSVTIAVLDHKISHEK